MTTLMLGSRRGGGFSKLLDRIAPMLGFIAPGILGVCESGLNELLRPNVKAALGRAKGLRDPGDKYAGWRVNDMTRPTAGR